MAGVTETRRSSSGASAPIGKGFVVNDDAPLPMPDEPGLANQADESEGTRLPMPADTVELLTGKPEQPEDDQRHDKSAQSKSDDPSSGSKLNMDTALGRLVVEQGLATNDEVQQAQRSQREAADPSGDSLAQVLVNSGAITKAQLDRLKSQVEAERSGQQIPGFKIIAKVGAGAMAAVFKARQISLDRMVAIKVLPRKFNGNRQFIERFYAEGRAAAQLNHPNIVQAYDVGKAGEFHYFVMEYVEGGTVHDTIVQNKRFQEVEAIEIVINIADALQHAHEKGLIHRDVKPKNVMMTPNGVAKLADLGLARAIDDKDAALAEKGKAYGTPYYISPEQIRGEVNVGPQADIYSLGATLYHMVTGNVPFNGKSPKEVMEKHLKEKLIAPDHVNPQLSSGISEVIEMMMAKSRRDRYKDCKDLLVDLRTVKRGETPPIAHKDFGGMDLAAVAALQEAATQKTRDSIELPKDTSGKPSFWSYSEASIMLVLLIVAVVWAAVMTLLRFA